MGGRLEGKVAVVTGGANGIGKAVSERLASEGADIVIVDIADGSGTAAEVRKSGRRGSSIRCDLTIGEDVAAMARKVESDHGGCDILIHNAGIYPATLFEDMNFDEWRKVLSINLDSVFHLVKAFLPGMKSKGWGRIVSMSSTTFHSGIGYNTHYTASKGGLIGFSRSLASEVGQYGVTVNTVAPGLTKTGTTENGPHVGWFDMLAQQQAIKRTETPADLVGPVAFLASDDAAFITGQTLVVDGGWRFS